MSDPDILDVVMHGFDRITAAFLVRGRQTALVETGPKSSIDALTAALDAAGAEDIDWIVVTHIHLDHAGAAGTLAARWPDARVAVHPLGAPHLADPTKLWASAGRIYGDQMIALWGGIDPIDSGRIVAIQDGDVIDLGGRRLTAIETPGHARHHHAYLDDAAGVVLCGDALGVCLPESAIIRPATPPPEFDLESAVASVERIRDLDAASLWFTHFGPHDTAAARTPAETCERAIEALRKWEKWVRRARTPGSDLETVSGLCREYARADLENHLSPLALERLEQTTSYRMNAWGYMRYLDAAASRSRPRRD